MARYSADAKEQVRDAVDMFDLVSSRTELRRAGANRFEGLCPFHEVSAAALEYLAGRRIEEATLREFRVGYAPSAYDRMLRAARQAGFSNREAYDAGLAQRSKGQGQLYARFRRRIMFPLTDHRGRVLGYGARHTGDAQGPKYLNTPEGDLYHKGRQLFGLALARPEAARAGEVVLVEGYTDVLAMHQGGL